MNQHMTYTDEYDQPITAEQKADEDRRFLHGAYVYAIVFPVIGFLMAIHIAVGTKRASLRNHVAGLVGVSLAAAVVYVVVLSALGS